MSEQHRRLRGDAHWRRRRTLPSVEIADALRARVEGGELGPGQRLPRLRDLAAEHHVSVGTVVRALGMLKHDGTLVTGPGNGTYVRSRAVGTGRSSSPDAVVRPTAARWATSRIASTAGTTNTTGTIGPQL
jgi:DNA-binding FadR family transcriptional regulator